jgi:hypothetical protein
MCLNYRKDPFVMEIRTRLNIRPHIRSIGNLVLLASFAMVTGCKHIVAPPQALSTLIDSIVYSWVPDSRENLCNIDIEMLSKNKMLVSGETNLPEAKVDILKCIEESGIEYCDSIRVLPGRDVKDKPWGLVSVSVCNIKKSPSHSSELVSQAIMGTPVKILKKRGGWLLVQTPDYYIGWANDSGIKEFNEKEIAEWKKSDRLIFTAKSGDILPEKDEAGVVSDIVAGAIVSLIAEEKEYYLIGLPDGRRGRIDKKDSRVFNKWCSEIRPEADKLISFARSLTGSPYLWGGTSTKMADCSGFVKTVWFTGGVILARDASQQFRYGATVDISSSFDDLQPGDQIFFGHLNSEGEKIITHTGLYIGDSEVIHSSGMIRVNSLDSTRSNYSSYLIKTIMGARRLMGSESEKGIEYVALHKWYR